MRTDHLIDRQLFGLAFHRPKKIDGKFNQIILWLLNSSTFFRESIIFANFYTKIALPRTNT